MSMHARHAPGEHGVLPNTGMDYAINAINIPCKTNRIDIIDIMICVSTSPPVVSESNKGLQLASILIKYMIGIPYCIVSFSFCLLYER